MAGADSRQIDGNGGAVLFQPQVTDGLCAVMPVVLELVRGFNVWEIDGIPFIHFKANLSIHVPI